MGSMTAVCAEDRDAQPAAAALAAGPEWRLHRRHARAT